jgi:hypothetical protein
MIPGVRLPRMSDCELNPPPFVLAQDSDGPSAGRPRVIEYYSGYKPPFNVARAVSRMLDSVPPKYLNGLSEVVLTNPAGLSRHRRRSTTKSRGRKGRSIDARGLYHPAWNGKQAWIEIFVDQSIEISEKKLWGRFGFMRETALGSVLFHEIGHHIHATVCPEFREKEDIADDWGTKLGRRYIQLRHPWIVRRFIGMIVRILIKIEKGPNLRG